MMTELCKHDCTGDEECAYCKCEELERQLAAKAASNSLEGYREMGRQLAEKDARIDQWKKEVIKWQDTDTENQEAIESLREDKDVEIAALKKGFIDVDEAFAKDIRISKPEQAIHNTLENELTETKPEIPSFTEEQIRGWIKEEEDVIRAWIVDEMKRFFNLANKAQMDQQIKVIEACGFKVIPEDDKDPSVDPQDTIDRIKANSYYEATEGQ